MTDSIMQIVKERVLLLDGGMGSQIFTYKPSVDDYGGTDFEGCVEFLNERRPEWIRTIHENYFNAGADAVESNTFGCNELVLSEFGLAHRTFELNKMAVALAREAAQSFNSRKYVVGSVGPGTKLVTLGHVDHAALFRSYLPQMRGLIAGGVDAILIETCQDLGQIKAAVRAAREAFREHKKVLPIWVQVTIETNGAMLVGTDILAALHTIEALGVDVIGMNCAAGPAEMLPHVTQLCQSSRLPVSCLPNAGIPENISGKTVYPLGPEAFAEKTYAMAKDLGLNILGGCCGTTPAHIAALAKKIGSIIPRRPAASDERFVTSLYSSVSLAQKPAPTFVGERTNANGSKLFRDKLGENDFEAMVEIAKSQAREGAHILDVSVAYVSRNETTDMVEFLKRLVTQVNIPLMIDSTEVGVIEAALQTAPGKCLVNSINFEDGEAKARQILGLCRTYGAAVVALTIDEKGMAKSTDEKLRIAHRLYALATQEFGLHPGDLVIDPLTFTLASGDSQWRDSAKETLAAIARIKSELPGVQTILGLSNVSFGLKPRARQILNSVMLFHAIDRGLDMAILNASKIIPISRISPSDRTLFEALLFNHCTSDTDPLKAILDKFSDASASPKLDSPGRAANLSLEEKIRLDIIDGNKTSIVENTLAALEKFTALEIINQVLLEAMKTVGERFGKGEMQLPFVLGSAEAMKLAVRSLEPHLPKATSICKGRILLATVKGDVHDIGKNLVDIVLSNNGFEVINIGIKQPVEQIVKALETHSVQAIGLSGLLVKSTAIMKEDLEYLAAHDITIPVILGGAALTRQFVEKDCQSVYSGKVFYAKDAFDGLQIMEMLCREASPSEKASKAERNTSSASSSADASPKIRVVNKAGFATTLDANGQSSWVKRNHPVYTPPFYGTQVRHDSIEDIFGYLDEFALIRSRWGFVQGALSEQEFERTLQTQAYPILEKLKARIISERLFSPAAVYGFFPACSGGDGNEILIYSPETISKQSHERKDVIARLNLPRQKHGHRLSIADFLKHESCGEVDTIGLQLVTMGSEASEQALRAYVDNEFRDYFLLHGLSTELAEAYAELVHKRVRKELGIDSSDAPSMREVFNQGYQGSRYSFGYPACPDLESNVTLLQLLGADRIGVTVSDTFQMIPEQSTCALIVSHPQARYFSV